MYSFLPSKKERLCHSFPSPLQEDTLSSYVSRCGIFFWGAWQIELWNSVHFYTWGGVTPRTTAQPNCSWPYFEPGAGLVVSRRPCQPQPFHDLFDSLTFYGTLLKATKFSALEL